MLFRFHYTEMVDMTLTQMVFYRLTLVFQKAKVKQFFLAPVPTIRHNRSINHNHPPKNKNSPDLWPEDNIKNCILYANTRICSNDALSAQKRSIARSILLCFHKTFAYNLKGEVGKLYSTFLAQGIDERCRSPVAAAFSIDDIIIHDRSQCDPTCSTKIETHSLCTKRLDNELYHLSLCFEVTL